MAKVNNPKRSFKNIAESLQKIVECPMCLDTIKFPFKQCGRGHGVCVECIKNLTACPLCQEQFTLENPVCLRNLIEALPQVCRYAGAGCDEVFDPRDDHERFCGFRPVSCREKGCKETVPLLQMLQHYTTTHPNRDIIDSENENLYFSRFHMKNKFSDHVPVFLFDQFFNLHLSFNVKEKLLIVLFQVIPNGIPIDDYFVRVNFEKDKFEFTNVLKATILNTCERKKTSSGEIFSNYHTKEAALQQCMTISQDMLSTVIDGDGTLKANIKIFTK